MRKSKHIKFFENFKEYKLFENTVMTVSEIEDNINIEPRHQEILNMMPDYSKVKASLVNTVGGLGYVGNFKEREISRGKAISTTILFDDIPTSEIFTHELLHYFTIPILVRYTENPENYKGSVVETYVKSLMSLAKLAQSKGYSAVNGVSVHNNLNEFAVNITNRDSCNKLKDIKLSMTDGRTTTIYDMLMKITSDYLKSIK
jgi:hypothetical protein